MVIAVAAKENMGRKGEIVRAAAAVLGRGDRLVRGVLADDVAAAALDAEVLVDPCLRDRHPMYGFSHALTHTSTFINVNQYQV